MTKRVLINGAAGRIGRGVTFEAVTNSSLEVLALNDPAGIDFAVKDYTGRDPVHGIFPWTVEKVDNETLRINGKEIKFYDKKSPKDMQLKTLGIEMVVECSGFYGDPKDKKAPVTPENNGARPFLQEGVERVIQTYPALTADSMLIMGANHELYDPSKQKIISNASCTTKSLGIPLKILRDNGIEIDDLRMVTAHAATNSQQILPSLNNIGTHPTGATKALGYIIPELKGRMGGTSARVPTLDGSISYFALVAYAPKSMELTPDSLNQMFRDNVSNPRYEGRLGVLEGKGISTADIVKRRESALIIASETSLGKITSPHADKNAYHVFLASGYDNELGSIVDAVRLSEYVAKKG